MNPIHSIVSDWYTSKIIYEIPLIKSASVYMSLNNPSHDSTWFVVHVDSLKFLNLWRKEPYNCNGQISHGCPETWVKDYKFHYAVSGFAQGISNPVPLAEVTCQKHKDSRRVYERKFKIFTVVAGYETFEYEYVDFINGITRTIWLLTHGATWFPVICYTKDEADLLAAAAGIDSDSLRPVSSYANLTNDHGVPTA